MGATFNFLIFFFIKNKRYSLLLIMIIGKMPSKYALISKFILLDFDSERNVM